MRGGRGRTTDDTDVSGAELDRIGGIEGKVVAGMHENARNRPSLNSTVLATFVFIAVIRVCQHHIRKLPGEVSTSPPFNG